jgi:hypothetical protein
MNPEDVALPPHRSISVRSATSAGANRRPPRDAVVAAPSTSATAQDSRLGAEYRQLMQWYPRRWRLANEDAMLGTLLDQAEQ